MRFEVDVPLGAFVFAGEFVNTAQNGILFFSRAPRNRTALPKHPCLDHTYAAVGPTVRDLADALSRQPFLETSRPRPVTLDGRDAMVITVSVPEDANLDRCDDGRVGLYTGSTAKQAWTTHAGYVGRWWILDVGGDRHIIHAECTGCARDEHDLLAEMVRSVTFVPR